MQQHGYKLCQIPEVTLIRFSASPWANLHLGVPKLHLSHEAHIQDHTGLDILKQQEATLQNPKFFNCSCYSISSGNSEICDTKCSFYTFSLRALSKHTKAKQKSTNFFWNKGEHLFLLPRLSVESLRHFLLLTFPRAPILCSWYSSIQLLCSTELNARWNDTARFWVNTDQFGAPSPSILVQAGCDGFSTSNQHGYPNALARTVWTRHY